MGYTTLTVDQMPSHTHRIAAWGALAGTNAYAATYGGLDSTQSTGGSQPHTHALDGASGEANGLPPYYAMEYIMRCA